MREEEQAALRKQEAEIMDTLKEVIKNGKVERRSQPAVVIENKEPPEIPELSMGEMTESPFTGEDAVRYLARLSLGSQVTKTERAEEGGVEGEEKEKKGKGQQENEIGDNLADTDDSEETADKEVNGLVKDEKGEVSGGDVQGDRGLDGNKVSTASLAGSRDGAEDLKRTKQIMKKKKKKRKRRKKKSSRSTPTIEEIRKANLEELERETREIIREAAETLNRNQTPVLRRSPPKVYKLPVDGPALPVNTGKGSSKPKLPNTPKVTTTPTKSAGKTENGNKEDGTIPLASDEKSTSTSDEPKQQVTHSEDKMTPSTGEENMLPQKGGDSSTDKKLDKPSLDNKTDQDVAMNSSETGKAEPPVQETPPPHRVRMTREQIREAEMKRRFPGRRPWPTLEECEENPVPKTVVFTSTWLSVTAKGIKYVHVYMIELL